VKTPQAKVNFPGHVREMQISAYTVPSILANGTENTVCSKNIRLSLPVVEEFAEPTTTVKVRTGWFDPKSLPRSGSMPEVA